MPHAQDHWQRRDGGGRHACALGACACVCVRWERAGVQGGKPGRGWLAAPAHRLPPLPSPPPPQIMEAGPKVAMLPVVDDGKVQGLVTLHALVSAGL